MPQIIYKANSSGLIAQGDRSVTTYPSGLLKVEQTFIGLTANESTDRLQLQIGQSFPLDDSPSIDGVFIFPATQENRGADGFTTYKVSGYGRINEDGYAYFVPNELIYIATGDSGIFTEKWSARQKVTERVIIKDQDDEDPFGIDFEGVDLPIRTQTSSRPPEREVIWNLTRTDVQRTNFGKFTEIKTLVKHVFGGLNISQ